MKKIYVFFVFICSLSGAFAQKGFHAGLEGAFNAVFIMRQETYGQTELDYAPTFGWAGGIVTGYNFDNHFGLQLEGMYSKQGQHYNKQVANGPTTVRNVDLYYYHIPLLFKYNGGAQYPTRFYVMAGPQLSVLSSASIY